MREQSIAVRLEQLKNADASQSAIGRADRSVALNHFGVIQFENRGLMAAFVAALSRFLCSPQGHEHRTGLVEAEVWHRFADQEVQELWLNDEALSATTAAFGHVRLSGVRSGCADVSQMRLIIRGASAAAIGLEDAERILLTYPTLLTGTLDGPIAPATLT